MVRIAARLGVLCVLAWMPRLAAAADEVASPLGAAIEDFTLSDYRGHQWSLAAAADGQLVVVAFLGTECPLAKLYGPRLAALADEYGPRGVVVIGIDANRQDSVTEMAAYARRHGIEFPLLKDPGNRVADRFAARRTPEVFVLDAGRVVRYHGRIDDQYGVGYVRDEPTRRDLAAALDELLAGGQVSVPHAPPAGCLIGRVREPRADGEVTYSRHVARVLQDRCVECHREGEIAPFALTSYEETVGWAETIDEVVAERRMPPWHASPEHGRFANDSRLSDEELETIRRWVADGAPEGDPADLPPPRQFVEGWQLPREPDLVVAIRDEPYQVPAHGEVAYQYFSVDPGFAEDRWIAAAEIQPGNRAVVHHVLVFARGEGSAWGDGGGEFLAAYVPGKRVRPYPEGMAKRVPAGSRLVFQVHYTPIGSPQEDVSRIGLVFADPAEVRQVVVTANAANASFRIPPHADDYEVQARSLPAPVEMQLLAFMPHAHLRGKSFRYELVRLDGSRETLLDVPRYDFNWQTTYRLAEPIEVPVGAYIHCTARYDNSERNLNNPDPSATVRWGDQTWEEMMIGYFDVAVTREALEGFSLQRDPRQDHDQQDPEARVDEVMERLDRDGDGRLTRAEVPERLLEVFERVDADDDDIVTRDELRAAVEREG